MSYIESNLVAGDTVTYQTRLDWIAMLCHIALGCLLFGLPGVFLLYYALRQAGIESTTLDLMEGGGVSLIFSGAVVILMGSSALKPSATFSSRQIKGTEQINTPLEATSAEQY